MSSNPAITARGLGKTYVIASGPVRSTTLGEALSRSARIAAPRRSSRREFTALHDVSFDIAQGEAFGIVGRNGAGKSTLLKILNRITRPTSGRAEIYGRVGSLLEIGAGFHPELTGRENIYLNGAMFGMPRREIRGKFDSIVDFAGTAEFLDTPVKRYSTGMYVRLAFAVAAHLEPDILLVDEVLAVGDAQFQKKCLGKMREVSQNDGRTVLFVSHNMGAVTALTSRAIFLESGRVAALGPTPEIVRAYMSRQAETPIEWSAKNKTTHPVQILSARLLNSSAQPSAEFEASDGFTVELTYEVRTPARNTLIEFFIYTADGIHLVTCGDHDTAPGHYALRTPGAYTTRVKLPGDLLNLGDYYLRINSGTHQLTYDHEDALRFRIVQTNQLNSRTNRRGLLLPMLPWQTETRAI
ncbi:MAG: ABC transporter ATP-binding protein [Chthoniobacteraceae bacterium]|jgi:lipopolysaccharide transport system ATP-binding protein